MENYCLGKKSYRVGQRRSIVKNLKETAYWSSALWDVSCHISWVLRINTAIFVSWIVVSRNEIKVCTFNVLLKTRMYMNITITPVCNLRQSFWKFNMKFRPWNEETGAKYTWELCRETALKNIYSTERIPWRPVVHLCTLITPTWLVTFWYYVEQISIYLLFNFLLREQIIISLLDEKVSLAIFVYMGIPVNCCS